MVSKSIVSCKFMYPNHVFEANQAITSCCVSEPGAPSFSSQTSNPTAPPSGDYPSLPTVPPAGNTNPALPSVPTDNLGGSSANDDIDFDDLTKRFEELKKKK